MNIKQTHPKIWLDDARVVWLRANQGRLEWKRLLTNCEDGLHRDEVGLPPTYDSALNYALVYRVTGSSRHADFAVKLVERYVDMGVQDAMTRVGATGPHGFGARIVIPECAVAYDWLHPYLPASTKTRWADFIMGCCDYSWLETNPTKGMPPRTTPSTVGQTWPGDNFYVGFLMSLIAAIALYGEHPKAAGHLDLGQKKLAALQDYIARYGRGGVSLEGTNYGTWIRHGFLQAALATGTDQPAFPDTFLTDATLSRWYLTTPDKKHMIPYGGQPVGADAPIVEDHTAIALVALSHGQPGAKGWAKSWLDSVTFTRKRQNSWMPALWYDNRVPAASVKGLPLNFQGPGSGVVTMRSSWETDATMLYFVCGPVKESHQEYAAGTFGIYKRGEWLTGPARLWGLGGEMLPSEYHNVLLVGQEGAWKGQPGQVQQQALPKDGMGITSFTGTIVEGEASDGYAYYKSSRVWPVLESWRRRVIYSPPNRVMVIDRVRKVNPLDEVLWQLHCRLEPGIDQNNYWVLGENTSLRGTVIVGVPMGEPAPFFEMGFAHVMKGKGGALSSHRLWVRVPGGAKEVVITNTLEVIV